MGSFCIRKTRIGALRLPKGYDAGTVNIGVPVTAGEHLRVGLKECGDAVLPSAAFGPACTRNAYGASYADKTQEKEYRYVSTVWTRPYGNEEAYPAAIDVYRTCYPKVEVPPAEIELVLAADPQGSLYVMAVLTAEVRNKHLHEAVNLFLEIYGYCYIFNGDLEGVGHVRQRCHWKMLPPGARPSEHLKEQLRSQGKNPDTFDADRLAFVEQYTAERIVEGVNGFNGYYAYVFKNYCVLECAVYGNATYIIPKENWEELSQKTKRELMEANCVKQKIIHTAAWYEIFSQAMRLLEGQ